MDVKEIRNCLKEAKEAIKNKNIEKALELCKAVLAIDHKNYMGLVIYGAALQESKFRTEALNVFREAIDINPEQLLAWQGLASYYEKEEHPAYEALLSVYKNLLLLEKESIRRTELCKKVGDMLKNISRYESIEDLALILDSSNVELQSLILNTLSKFFSELKEIADPLLNIYKKVLQRKLEHYNFVKSPKDIQNYLNILQRQKNYNLFLIEFERLLGGIDDYDVPCLELLCTVYCELSISTDFDFKSFDIGKYCDTLLNFNKDSFVGLIVKSICLHNTGDYIGCRDTLNHALESDCENWLVYYYLSKVYFTLYCFNDAVLSIIYAQDLLPANVNSGVKADLNRWLLEALSRSDKYTDCEQCLEKCIKVLSSDSDNILVLKCLTRAAITLEKWSLVDETLEKITEKDENLDDPDIIYLKAVHVSNLDVNKAIFFLKDAILEEPKYASHLLLLGELCWRQGSLDVTLDCFLKAAKLSPFMYKAFLNLGHYYREINQDWNKARRCYQKAFQFCPRSNEVGKALSDVYRKLNMKENNFELLSRVTAAGSEKWAWLRLGLNYLDSGDANLAVSSLRTAIRMDPKDCYCWELLGDALFARGSFTSAMKCYQKSFQLNPASLYASLQIASVKQRIGLHDESIKELRNLIEQNQTYIPALKVLAEVCLSYARELFSRQMLGSTRDLCEEAAAALTEILKQKNNLICIWKLLADSCILVCRLPDRLSYVKLPSFLFSNDSDDSMDTNSLSIHRNNLFDFSLRCYSAAIQIGENSQFTLSYLWHDIAFCYNLRADYSADEDYRMQQRQFAFDAAKKSVSLSPRFWEHWNLLGVIALSKEMKNLPLAQHCFIKAVDLESNSAVSWSNLGTLYLQLHDIQLANQAFQAAQRADPKYPRSWIGQAIIAEFVDHDETVDLFYHSTVLGYHQESAKGYAEWICKIVKDWDTYKKNPYCYYLVEKMHGVQSATTLMTWYTAHYPDSAYATNMLSVLSELCGLNRSAVSLSKSSLQKVDQQNADIVYSNLGRQLRKLSEHKEAIEIFRRIKEIDFPVQCEFALTLYLAGNYEEALSNYESALHWLAPDDGYKAQIMVAIAALHYIRNKKEDTQTILLECTRLKPTPVHGLFAACAFGMLNKQLMLSKLVLKELELFKNEKEYTSHIALFNTYCEVFQGNLKSAIKVMSKFIFNYPGSASIWLSLCHLLLHLIFSDRQEYIRYSLATAYHARCAVSLGRGIIDISKIYSTISLSYLLAGLSEQCLRSSLKAVYLYPDVAESWAVLIAVEYSRGTNYPKVQRIITHVRKKLVCSKVLDSWLNSIQQKITSITG